MQLTTYCHNALLPPEKAKDYELRNSESSYVLLQIAKLITFPTGVFNLQFVICIFHHACLMCDF